MNMELTPENSIPAFFAGRSILVTGGTGFMGKVLTEKLLRSCDVREIFLLMRPKKGISIDERLNKILSNELFDRLKKEKPNEIHKIIPVTGDIAVEGLGLPVVERQFLIERVSVIFHVAANVRFDDSLKEAVFTNLRSTRDVCILAANMKQLVSLVHVSSTYTQADKPEVDEITYPSIMDWKKMIKIAENVDDHHLRTLTSKFLGGFPNTYTFTKRLAEQVIVDYSNTLPSVLFRPSIVISTAKEPISGWIDNFNGPVGMMVGGGKGVLRVLYAEPNHISDYMPVDVAIKAMITSSWKRGIITKTRDPSVHVYNCSSSDRKSITMKGVVDMALEINENLPLEGCMWYPNTSITTSSTYFFISMLFVHLLPAMIIDGVLKLIGRRAILVKLQRKVYVANIALQYFLLNQWTFKNEKTWNLLSQDLSPTDYPNFSYEYLTFDINAYFRDALIGTKKFLLNEKVENFDKARNHLKTMKLIDRMFKILLAALFVYLSYRDNILREMFITLKNFANSFIE